MLTSVRAGPYTIRGISLGGVYTTLHVPEIDSAFDCGLAPRTIATARNLFLSHGHVDHIGALTSMLGIRDLAGQRPLRVFLPAQIEEAVLDLLHHASRMHRWELTIESVPMQPGQEVTLRNDLTVRAFKTFHPVPSLGYQFLQRVEKLRPELRGLPGKEIAARRRAGQDLFETQTRYELAYATDTLARVLDAEPSLLESRVLILECTFLDERKSLADSRAGCHIHLDELLAIADRFRNEHLVLMHFSQIYRPREVREILERRCPPELWSRIVPFAPASEWPG